MPQQHQGSDSHGQSFSGPSWGDPDGHQQCRVDAIVRTVLGRESGVDELTPSPEERSRMADERDRIADARDRIADERDDAADLRDRMADDRQRSIVNALIEPVARNRTHAVRRHAHADSADPCGPPAQRIDPSQERLGVPNVEHRLDFCAKTSRQTAKSRLDRIPSPVDDLT